MPVIILGSVFLAAGSSGFLPDLLGGALPFMITFWIGSGFAFAWGTVRASMVADRAAPGVAAAVGILGALVMLSMIGLKTVWEDPWIFGVAIWPGFVLAKPWLERRIGPRIRTAGRGVPVGQSSDQGTQS
jgi:hypothetical protein